MPTRFFKIMTSLSVLACADACAIDLVTNGNFKGSISGWTPAPSAGGVVQFESYLGSPDSGSLRIGAPAGATALATQCVDVHAWVSVDFTLRKIKNSEYGSGTHDFHVELYDGDACGGAKLGTITAPESGTSVDGIGGLTWIEVTVQDSPLPPGTRSALLSLQTSAGASSNSEYLLDQVRFGPLDVIFVDTFETP